MKRNPLSLLPRIIMVLAISVVWIQPAEGQLCHLPPYELVMPPGDVPQNGQYGRAMLTHGDWLFVGANLPSPGAVYAFKLNNGAYAFQQMLQPTGANEPTSFGASLAADGDRLLVGTRNQNAVGAAYIFSLDGTSWVQQQKLQPTGPGDPRGFGWSVAIQDHLAVISARSVLNDGVSGKGAAFVFEHNGKTWTPVQRLTNDVPIVSDAFGSTVAISNNTILVGAPRATSSIPAVFVFELENDLWTLQYKLHGTGAGLSGFGSSMAVDGNILIVGGAFGSEQVYRWNGDAWQFAANMIPSDELESADFGVTVAIRGNQALIASSMHRVDRPQQDGMMQSALLAGSVYVYDLSSLSQYRGNDDTVFETHRLELYQPVSPGILLYGPYGCWANGPQPSGWGTVSALNQANLGLAVAISDRGYLASSRLARPQCWGFTGTVDGGAVNLFEIEAPIIDCNANGAADDCEVATDCNGNDVPDECDIDASSTDCNLNNAPDECDQAVQYQIDPGLSVNNLIFFVSPATGNSDFIWLNQFFVKPGGQVITHVALHAHPYIPPNVPFTVMVYSDPNGDGNPDDAVLLQTATGSSLWYHSNSEPYLRMTIVPIEPTYVGEPGNVFFVGAVVHTLYLNDPAFPWCGPASESGASTLQRSWRAFAPPGEADIVNLANNNGTLQRWSNKPFVLRAIANDCNNNGTPDMCDISGGTSSDTNNNGIPDECETPYCSADVSPFALNGPGDGVVNVADLLQVITGWGGCSPCYTYCPGDTNDDCLVNVADILQVIMNWGPCPN